MWLNLWPHVSFYTRRSHTRPCTVFSIRARYLFSSWWNEVPQKKQKRTLSKPTKKICVVRGGKCKWENTKTDMNFCYLIVGEREMQMKDLSSQQLWTGGWKLTFPFYLLYLLLFHLHFPRSSGWYLDRSIYLLSFHFSLVVRSFPYYLVESQILSDYIHIHIHIPDYTIY